MCMLDEIESISTTNSPAVQLFDSTSRESVLCHIFFSLSLSICLHLVGESAILSTVSKYYVQYLYEGSSSEGIVLLSNSLE
ncbi:hypothetical protein BDV28DRAFT_59032 [Aspergillus coremiiformis]|uniref:Uncharacterized protein n=1 Tax=Aspergillus coremiiformis TaxID=138285 RepID=A0A5N6YWN6_9EURO|nr:hypothetical protein BDV28DRAFT_59032 [Aspergillus coremiiformis]